MTFLKTPSTAFQTDLRGQAEFLENRSGVAAQGPPSRARTTLPLSCVSSNRAGMSPDDQ
jgi:hypothetical protein